MSCTRRSSRLRTGRKRRRPCWHFSESREVAASIRCAVEVSTLLRLLLHRLGDQRVENLFQVLRRFWSYLDPIGKHPEYPPSAFLKAPTHRLQQQSILDLQF